MRRNGEVVREPGEKLEWFWSERVGRRFIGSAAIAGTTRVEDKPI